MFDAVKARVFDGMHCFDAYWTAKIPVAAFLSSYPFGLDRPDQWETWYNALGGKELAREAFARHNMHHIGPIQQGENLIHAKVPIRSFEDFKGKKIKCFGGITADFFRAIGAIPVPLPGKDVHPTIDQDDIDALYYGGAAINANSRYSDTAKYIIADTPASARLHRQVNIMSIAINKRTWNMIPKPLQLLFEAAVAQYSYDQYAAFQKADMETFEKLEMEQGIEIIRLNESDVEKLKRFAPAMWVKWAKKSPLAMKAFESQLAFLKSKNLDYITEEGMADLDGKKLVY
jgi:TRAP-type mannitol/chloroaromatic compound transport system substrate-binding protein